MCCCCLGQDTPVKDSFNLSEAPLLLNKVIYEDQGEGKKVHSSLYKYTVAVEKKSEAHDHN